MLKTLEQLAVALLVGTFASGCLFLAPIEEEAEIPDDPPRFDETNAIRPPIGTVPIDLEDGGIRAFVITRVYDINTSQVLYWRAIVDYGVFLVASVPAEIPPSQREATPITYQYSPCTEPDRIWTEQGGQFTFYLAVSDAPFASPAQFFDPEQRSRPFQTEGDRPVVWVSWPLQLEGRCPNLPVP